MDDDEERQLLADNVLEEAAGRAAALATDAACSRVLEALLPLASTPRLAAFVSACVSGEALATVCTAGPFGSHVLEKGLAALGGRAEVAGGEEWEALEAALAGATAAIAGALYDVVTSKYGSFVARRLLCVLAGRDVAPPPPRKGAAAAGLLPALPGEAEAAAAARPRPGGGALAQKLGTTDGGGGDGQAASAAAEPPHHPALLRQLAEVVLGDDWSGPEMAALQVGGVGRGGGGAGWGGGRRGGWGPCSVGDHPPPSPSSAAGRPSRLALPAGAAARLRRRRPRPAAAALPAGGAGRAGAGRGTGAGRGGRMGAGAGGCTRLLTRLGHSGRSGLGWAGLGAGLAGSSLPTRPTPPLLARCWEWAARRG